MLYIGILSLLPFPFDFIFIALREHWPCCFLCVFFIRKTWSKNRVISVDYTVLGVTSILNLSHHLRFQYIFMFHKEIFMFSSMRFCPFFPSHHVNLKKWNFLIKSDPIMCTYRDKWYYSLVLCSTFKCFLTSWP